MQVTRPLFRFDAGWLYALAGVALCAAGILVPVQQDLQDLERQLAEIRTKEHLVTLQLKSSSTLLDEFDQGDANLIRRLAASQLNLIPSDRRPLLRSTSAPQTVSEWVDDSIRYERPVRAVHQMSMLSRLSSGSNRLWLFGSGVLCVFIGLLLDPALSAINRKRTLRLSGRQPSRDSILAVRAENRRAIVGGRSTRGEFGSPGACVETAHDEAVSWARGRADDGEDSVADVEDELEEDEVEDLYYDEDEDEFEFEDDEDDDDLDDDDLDEDDEDEDEEDEEEEDDEEDLEDLDEEDEEDELIDDDGIELDDDDVELDDDEEFEDEELEDDEDLEDEDLDEDEDEDEDEVALAKQGGAIEDARPDEDEEWEEVEGEWEDVDDEEDASGGGGGGGGDDAEYEYVYEYEYVEVDEDDPADAGGEDHRVIAEVEEGALGDEDFQIATRARG